jgi:hypothetical protein
MRKAGARIDLRRKVMLVNAFVANITVDNRRYHSLTSMTSDMAISPIHLCNSSAEETLPNTAAS